MHWLEVEGLRVPVRIGGHPALDFCNTWAGWGQPPSPRREWLKTYDHLVVWSLHADLIALPDVRRLRRSAARDPHHAHRVLTEARSLRTATHTVVLDPTDVRAMAVVTGHLRHSGSVVRVEAGRPPRWSFPPGTGLELPLFTTAWAVGDLLTQIDLDRVKQCPGHDCGWMFVDTTGRRRWCSMTSCGNRAKVNAFARRRKATSGPLGQ
ncbi:MAG: CGNR zinc finger domain-containing protein [Propionibacteriales bacterium]|nr:CGNR zinc finger domain-containing protein [Propionibacteriales bacterium]